MHSTSANETFILLILLILEIRARRTITEAEVRAATSIAEEITVDIVAIMVTVKIDLQVTTADTVAMAMLLGTIGMIMIASGEITGEGETEGTGIGRNTVRLLGRRQETGMTVNRRSNVSLQIN